MPNNRLSPPASATHRKRLIGDVINEAMKSYDEPSLQKSLAKLDAILERDEIAVIDYAINTNFFQKIICFPQNNHLQPTLAQNITSSLFIRLYFRLNDVQRDSLLRKRFSDGLNLLQQVIASRAVTLVNIILESIKNDYDLLSCILTNKNDSGNMPLNSAILSHNHEIIMQLLHVFESCPEVLRENLCNSNQGDFTPLDNAIKSDNSDFVEALLAVLKMDPEALHQNLCHRNQGGFMPLDSAIKFGNSAIVKALLEVLKKDQDALSATLRNSTNGGFMPLESALNSDKLEIIKALLEVLANDQKALHQNLCHRSPSGFMPLDCAIKHGDPVIVEVLLDVLKTDEEALHQNLYNRTQGGFTPLDSGIISGNVVIVKALLEVLNKDLNALNATLRNRTKSDLTALNVALNSKNLEIVKAILEVLLNDPEALHQNLSHRNHGGFMSLHCAIKSGDPSVVKLLLEVFENDREALGANLRNCTESDFTPLDIAINSGSLEIINALFAVLESYPEARHHNLCYRNQCELMPLDITIKLGNLEILAAVFQGLAKDEYALHQNLCHRNQGGFMPLDSAIKFGNAEIVKALLEVLKKDEDAIHQNLCNRTRGGFTPLDTAIRSGNAEIVKALLEVLVNDPEALHQNLCHRTQGGFMPLYSALKLDNVEMVKALLEVLEKDEKAHHRSICNRNERGWGLLQSIISDGQLDTIRFILRYLLTWPNDLIQNLHNINNNQFSCFDTAVASQNSSLLKEYLAVLRLAYQDDKQAQVAFNKLYANRKRLKEYDIPEIKEIIENALEGNFPISEYLTFTPVEPFAGINAKYLTEDPPPMVPKKNMAIKTKSLQYRLSHLASNEEVFAKSVIEIESACLCADYYSKQAPIAAHDKVTFICAGREQHALFPLPQQGRAVLVYTEEEFAKLSALQVNLDKADVLVLKKIETVYGASASLKLLTSRRLGIFLMADYCRLNHFMMLDDNIRQVQFNPQKPTLSPDWDVFYDTLQQQLKNETCISVTRHVAFPPKSGQLGSKLFMINLQKIREQFSTPEALTLLFPEPMQAHKWGEDYYFQLMLHYAFHSQTQGYRVISKEIATLIRSMKHRNAFANSQGKRILAEHFTLPNIATLPAQQQGCLQQTVHRLNKIIDENKQRFALSAPIDLQVNSGCPLAESSIAIENQQTLPTRVQTNSEEEPIVEDEIEDVYHPANFMDKLCYNLRFLANEQGRNDYLRYYQVNALQRLLGEQQANHASIIMAAGSGKTRTQSALACLGFEHLRLGEHLVIVTENVNLVTQFYENLLNNRFLYTRFLQDEIIPETDIIPVSYKHTSVETILADNYATNGSKVFVFCKDSFMNILKLNPSFMSRIKLLMLDEYHTYSSSIKLILDQAADTEDQLILGFTATPPEWNPLPPIFGFSLSEAINRKVVAPIIADCAVNKFSARYITQCIQQRYHPGFAKKTTLASTKGIIYLSDQQQCDELHRHLQAQGIQSFVINSNNQNYENDLAVFKQSKSGVILACRMCIIGYDDPEIAYVMITNNPSDTTLEQMICRTNRLNGTKIGYVITFQEQVHERVQLMLKNQRIHFNVNEAFRGQSFKHWKYHFAQTMLPQPLRQSIEKKRQLATIEGFHFPRKPYAFLPYKQSKRHASDSPSDTDVSRKICKKW